MTTKEPNIMGLVTHATRSAILYNFSKDMKSPEASNAVINYAIQPAVKSVLKMGSPTFPSELAPGEIALVLANHQSDLDNALILSSFLKSHKATAVAYDQLANIPVFGAFVKTDLITAGKGDTNNTMKAKFQKFIDLGYNTFLLYPEGCHMQKSAYEKSIEYQKKLGVELMHEVCYPRKVAFEAFMELTRGRLRYIVDVTINYEGYNPRTMEFNHLAYPSFAYSFTSERPPPFMRIEQFECKDGAWYEAGWLDALWRRKERFLQRLRSGQPLAMDISKVKLSLEESSDSQAESLQSFPKSKSSQPSSPTTQSPLPRAMPSS